MYTLPTNMRKAQRQESQRVLHETRRQSLDKLGRSNVNKRGPKTGEDVIIQSHTSRLKSGVTCNYSRNVVTLPDGRQCLEGSLTQHSIPQQLMRKKLDDVTWVLNQPVVSYTLKKHLLWWTQLS